MLNIHYLQENFKLQLGSKICNFFSLYRSTSQTSHDFGKFTDNFELPLDTIAEFNSHLIVVLAEFNIKSKNWYINDKTTPECANIEFSTSQYGLYQIITLLTHVLETFLPCIDLIFTSQPNFVVDSGVHPSLHLNYNDQIVYVKLNLKNHFPPTYQREKRYYSKGTLHLLEGQFMNLTSWEHLVT